MVDDLYMVGLFVVVGGAWGKMISTCTYFPDPFILHFDIKALAVFCMQIGIVDAHCGINTITLKAIS